MACRPSSKGRICTDHGASGSCQGGEGVPGSSRGQLMR